MRKDLGIALKASNCIESSSSNDDDKEEDFEEMNYLTRKFHKFLEKRDEKEENKKKSKLI